MSNVAWTHSHDVCPVRWLKSRPQQQKNNTTYLTFTFGSSNRLLSTAEAFAWPTEAFTVVSCFLAQSTTNIIFGQAVTPQLGKFKLVFVSSTTKNVRW